MLFRNKYYLRLKHQKSDIMRVLSLTVYLGISMLLFSSCGGETKPDNIGPVADTNAGTSPGMTAQNDEAELKEEDKQKATGTWVQTQSGEVYATLTCKYANGAIQYTLSKGCETQALLQGTADNMNDSRYFEGQDTNCPVTLEFDKEKFTVKIDAAACKATTMDFNGVYTRK